MMDWEQEERKSEFQVQWFIKFNFIMLEDTFHFSCWFNFGLVCFLLDLPTLCIYNRKQQTHTFQSFLIFCLFHLLTFLLISVFCLIYIILLRIARRLGVWVGERFVLALICLWNLENPMLKNSSRFLLIFQSIEKVLCYFTLCYLKTYVTFEI